MATSGPIAAAFDAGTTLGLGPSELLGRFGATRDEAAFAALVEHHGPMVLATCRRILPDPSDADDAFQATFLVLARKARSIADPDRLAPWLHGVARRVSVKARARAARRRQVEEAAPGPVAGPAAGDDAIELRSVLDEELARLPAKYRAPLVLCYLEGLTHDQAAGQLRWPVGTVRSRLAGGRDRLRSRLARRGFAPGVLATLSPATLPSAAVSHLLRAATVRLAFTPISGTVATPAALLAQGVLTSMFLTKVQIIAITLAGVVAAGTTGVVVARQQPGADQKPASTPTTTASKAAPDDSDVAFPPNPANYAVAIDRIKALEAELVAIRKSIEPVPLSSMNFRPARLVDKPEAKATPDPNNIQTPGSSPNKPADPPPAPPDLVKELDAAKARIKTLEAEFAALKQRQDQPNIHSASIGKAGGGNVMGGGMGGGAGGMGMGLSGPNGAGGMGGGMGAAMGGMGGGGGMMGGGMGTMAGGIMPPGMGAGGGMTNLGAKRPGNLMSGPMLLGNGKVLFVPPERNRIMAVDTNSGFRDVFRPTGEVTGISPISSSGVVGLGLTGPKITQTAAYSVQGSRWYPVDLREPVVDGHVDAAVGANYVTLILGRFHYMFSAQAQRWGVLELKQPLMDGGRTGRYVQNADSLMITEDNTLHIFNFATGEWSHIDTKDESTVQPATEPADPKLPK